MKQLNFLVLYLPAGCLSVYGWNVADNKNDYYFLTRGKQKLTNRKVQAKTLQSGPLIQTHSFDYVCPINGRDAHLTSIC